MVCGTLYHTARQQPRQASENALVACGSWWVYCLSALTIARGHTEALILCTPIHFALSLLLLLLLQVLPRWVVYHELVLTSKEFMRTVRSCRQ